jgi:cell wall-associated NlpC family hydrolase
MTTGRKLFSLSGKSARFDPRVDALRDDLADVTLAGRLFAPHYADAVPKRCAIPFAPMFSKPKGEQSSELLCGETFMLLDISGGWAWGWSEHDHYVGYVEATMLEEASDSGQADAIDDPLTIARSFLGLPYVWGGRGGAGIDCSGLVQRSVAGIGIKAQRDSDMQQATLGDVIPDDQDLRPGDIIFFPGHVGMMVDSETLIHATRYHGKTVEEPLTTVVARVAAKHDGVSILARKRIRA